MFVEKTSTIDLLKKIQDKNEHTTTVVDEACRTIAELQILEDALVDDRIRKLTTGVCDAKIELVKVQLELKAHPSTPPEIRQQREATIKDAVATIDAIVKDCTTLFEQSLEVVISLHEDPNLQRLETEARELQQRYDEVRPTTRNVAITQRLTKLQEAKALKEQVDVAQRMEAVLKARLGPWLDEAYVLTATIEGKLAILQETHKKIQVDSAGPTTKQLVEQAKQAVTQCSSEVVVVQVELGGLRDKISAPAK